eukprot:6456407-Amphidinium_carterae.1
MTTGGLDVSLLSPCDWFLDQDPLMLLALRGTDFSRRLYDKPGLKEFWGDATVHRNASLWPPTLKQRFYILMILGVKAPT